MNVTDALLDSWDRQCRIVMAVASLVNDANKNLKPSDDGWPLFEQLAHIHTVRREWLAYLDEDASKALPNLNRRQWSDPTDNLDDIRAALEQSAAAARLAVEKQIGAGNGKCGGYDNPVLYLQHQIWHEGWHVGLIMLGLRLAGQSPSDEWEEGNIWGEWRTEI